MKEQFQLLDEILETSDDKNKFKGLLIKSSIDEFELDFLRILQSKILSGPEDTYITIKMDIIMVVLIGLISFSKRNQLGILYYSVLELFTKNNQKKTCLDLLKSCLV